MFEAIREKPINHHVRLRPARVALFGYAHVPWMKSHQKLIDEAALREVYEPARIVIDGDTTLEFVENWEASL